MKILNFGSLNLDHVYRVKSFVQPGETISAIDYKINCGGKGLNQSVAVAKCGASVYHAGFLGNGADILQAELQKNNVDTSYILPTDIAPGHAIIQVDEKGENCILLHGGSNKAITKQHILSTISNFSKGDILLIQNETNLLEDMIVCAKNQGMQVAFNPAPFDEDVLKLPLNLIDYFIVNETEGCGFTNETEPQKILDSFIESHPDCHVILTLGKNGAFYKDKDFTTFVPIYDTGKPIDTTAAGDTFTGYFIGCISKGESIEQALTTASKAAGICVIRHGASASIPLLKEVLNYSK